MLDKEEAQKQVSILLTILQNDQDPIKLVALQGLFDLMLMYDLEQSDAVLSTSSDQPELSVIAQLVRFVDDPNSELQTAATEGVAKLLFMNKLGAKITHELLTKLLLLHFNPATQELEKLQQCLAAFFPLFPPVQFAVLASTGAQFAYALNHKILR